MVATLHFSFALLFLIVCVDAFTLYMGNAPKPSGFANTKAGKTAILERTKNLIGDSNIILSMPLDGVTKEQVDILRKEIPKVTKASVIKNSLMKKAVEGTKFEAIVPNVKGETMFFFIPEGESRSFAEMTLAEKNQFSHRARAIEKLVSFFNTLPNIKVII